MAEHERGRPAKLGRVLGYGTLWGAAVVAMESFTLPVGLVETSELLIFLGNLLPKWVLVGWVLALLTMAGMGRELRAWQLFLALLVMALANGLVWPLLRPSSPFAYADKQDVVAHVVWCHVAYGGMFVLACLLSRQSERTRSLLAQAEIARQQTETVLSAARLQALQSQVDPGFILQAMQEMQRRYELGAPEAVDALLEPLVAFLRAAMPSVRSGGSALNAELSLDLARLRAAVQAEMRPEAGRPS